MTGHCIDCKEEVFKDESGRMPKRCRACSLVRQRASEKRSRDKKAIAAGKNPSAAKSSVWTVRVVERLREMVAAAWTAAAIGKEIGVTRSAVLGKCHRIGLSCAGDTKSKAQMGVLKKRFAKSMKLRVATKPDKAKAKITFDAALQEMEAQPDVGRVKLLDLEPHHCRWPVGSPDSPSFAFCGEHRGMGSSYCKNHMIRAHRPPVVAIIPHRIVARAENFAAGGQTQDARTHATQTSFEPSHASNLEEVD
jgi:GcrA cell cycle regulator